MQVIFNYAGRFFCDIIISGDDIMTLQQLKYASVISETGQFSRASEKLFVTQPSLTKAINELEKELGFEIFTRSRRGVTVTERGGEFIIYARQVLMQFGLLEQKFKSGNNFKQRFAVSCQHYTFASDAFYETIKGFDNSKFDFAIRETTTRNVIHDVSTMRSEVGILFLADFNRQFLKKELADKGLEFHTLLKSRPYVFMCRDNPLSEKKYVTIDDLEPYPCIIYEQDEGMPYYYSEELLPLHNYSRIIKTTDKVTMTSLIAKMNGYTICTKVNTYTINGIEYTSVKYSGNDSENEKIDIGYIVRRGNQCSEIAKKYISELKAMIGPTEKN